ncbi:MULTISPECIES: DUF3622 domain-containing protein [Alphaproteobacteria]|uniref:DUF3622 domain-containing protein n=1 Tax=Alphaproteobacteria TaxID=28211 RepID=UPI0032ED2D36
MPATIWDQVAGIPIMNKCDRWEVEITEEMLSRGTKIPESQVGFRCEALVAESPSKEVFEPTYKLRRTCDM